MNNSFLSIDEIIKIGFKSIGQNVKISRKCSLYSPEKMIIGNNIRIDDFCILSGEITLGNYIHISAYTALYGSMGIQIDDYSGISPRCTIFSASDDFSGNFMIGPMINKELANVIGGKVYIKKYSQIGAGSIILPDLTIEEGVAVGAMSLVNKSLPVWTICVGIPAKVIKQRENKITELSKQIK